jgi:hypothetical protein
VLTSGAAGKSETGTCEGEIAVNLFYAVSFPGISPESLSA